MRICDDSVSPATLAINGTRTPQACHIKVVGDLIFVLDPVVAARGSYVENGQQYRHVNGSNQA